MGTERTLIIVTTGAGMLIAAAIEEFLRLQSGHRGRSGRVTSPETVRSYLSALPVAFAGITDVAALDTGPGRARLHANIRTAWGRQRRSTPSAPQSPRHWRSSPSRSGSPILRWC